MSYRIILADDHPLILTGVRSLIEKTITSGEVVAEAHSVSELFILLQQYTCELLITDLSMPTEKAVKSRDGLVMFQRLRSEYQNLPIIVLTQTQNKAILHSLIKAGANGLILKKSVNKELVDAINEVFLGNRYIGPSAGDLLTNKETSHSNTNRSLSPKESEVLRLLASGMSVTQVANYLHRSVKTISNQKKSAMIKLNITSDSALFEYAISSGLG